jgi:hypothetical protein
MLFAHYSSFSLGNSRPIKLVSSNEWMWSYRLSNWARLDKKKYVHLLYHLQAVFDDDDVTIAATRLWMWLTQPAMTMIPIVWNYFFFSCVHTSNLFGEFLSKVDQVSLKIKRLKTTLYPSCLVKPPKSLKPSLLQKPIKYKAFSY